MNNRYDVVVLGGGAAGLMCAMTAAGRGRSVVVLEKSNKIGKKILMSGGGRCNFTNYTVEPENFLCNNPHFCKSALKRYTQWDFIKMVEDHAIAFEERRHQQLFCIDSAKQILDMLQCECEQVGVQFVTHCELVGVKAQQDTNDAERFNVSLNVGKKDQRQQRKLECESLVVATGGLSIPTLGGSGIGYDIAQQFGLSLVERRAGLVPFMFSDSIKAVCERLSGVSLEVEVSCNDHSFTEAMLFTHRGMSGPVILQISSYWQPGDDISINLLPDTDVVEWLLETKLTKANSLLKTVLQQRLGKSLVAELQSLWWPQEADKPMAELSDALLKSIGAQINHWVLKPSATEGYRTAEVTLGGVNTDGVSSKTLEAKTQSGLYFVGEVLDVSGHLGGFNFQWAWASGNAAGQYA